MAQKNHNHHRRLALPRLTRLWAALAAIVALQASAATDYPALSARAERAYVHEEWASASALFDLMLEQRPDLTDTYGKAITARSMMADTAAQLQLMAKALDNHLPFETVFAAVRTSSYDMGHADAYEGFLRLVGSNYPWMRRTVDGYLLRYYSFRRNAPMMVEYSNRMLAGAPDNVGFLATKALGQMQMGEFADAVATYKQILTIDPANIDALLWLGNYYALTADSSATDAVLARSYLQQAFDLRPTPYVQAKLAKLP